MEHLFMFSSSGQIICCTGGDGYAWNCGGRCGSGFDGGGGDGIGGCGGGCGLGAGGSDC